MSPDKGHIFPSQEGYGGNDGAITINESLIEIGKSEEGLYVLNIS
jgi:hypothetical protein